MNLRMTRTLSFEDDEVIVLCGDRGFHADRCNCCSSSSSARQSTESYQVGLLGSAFEEDKEPVHFSRVHRLEFPLTRGVAPCGYPGDPSEGPGSP